MNRIEENIGQQNIPDENESLFGDISDVDDPTYVPEHGEDEDLVVMVSQHEKVIDEVAVDVNDNYIGNNSTTRKRKRNPENWKQNVRNRRRAAGLNYTDGKGKERSARTIGGMCECRMKCSIKINDLEQLEINKSYWKLSDEEKQHYYSKFVERRKKIRSRPRHLPAQEPQNCFKQYSNQYFFEINGCKVKICKTFFLNTLNISARRISYFFSTKYNQQTGTPKPITKGKNVKRCISTEKIEIVRSHINSFPRMESHYCRAGTKKEYLEPELNLATMYNLYKEKYPENQVKISKYRQIFNTEFNISFLKPKKDRCDICEEMKQKDNNISAEELLKLNDHKKRKAECKEERDKDRSIKDVNDVAIVSFDMENVFALPKANISNFYYKRKFSVFNLTAHCSANKKTYCAIWHEMISGRSGNHIASALFKILNKITTDLPNIRKIILWSDSCVPQNRNSVMSFALSQFLKQNPKIETIEQKFSETGHGNIQEVDAIHSLIEKKLRYSEIFSPVSLLRSLNALTGPKGKLIIIQLHRNDFFDFQTASKALLYSSVPYTKIKYTLIKSASISQISYKLSFSDELHNVHLRRQGGRRKENEENFTRAKIISEYPKISIEKKKDLKSMLKYMPEVDREFYTHCVLK